MARKILLADDSVTAQNMGRKILTDAGYEVLTVNNGSAALKRVAEHKPDLIVLDVYMPGYSGLEVCLRLKDSPDTARIPILLTVGKLEPFKPEDARRVRADAFIIKPFEASELLGALTRLEDRVVPQSDNQRYGTSANGIERFGSDSSTRRSESADDTETGWKNRLRFPSKKPKEPEPEPEVDYTTPAGFRSFRREPPKAPPKPTLANAPATEAVTARQEPVLVPDIPRDITPEELDALSALAAKLDGPALKIDNIAPADEAGPSTTAAAEARNETIPEAKSDVKAETPVEAKSDAEPAAAEIASVTPVEPPVSTPAEPVPAETAKDAMASTEPATAFSVPEFVAAPVDRADEPLFASAPQVPEENKSQAEVANEPRESAETAVPEVDAMAAQLPPVEVAAKAEDEPKIEVEAKAEEQPAVEVQSEAAELPVAEPVAKVEDQPPAELPSKAEDQPKAEEILQAAPVVDVPQETAVIEERAPTEEELAEALRLLTPSQIPMDSAEERAEISAREALVAAGAALAEEVTRSAGSNRWAAEVVTLSPEEASASLEAEMFQAVITPPAIVSESEQGPNTVAVSVAATENEAAETTVTASTESGAQTPVEAPAEQSATTPAAASAGFAAASEPAREDSQATETPEAPADEVAATTFADGVPYSEPEATPEESSMPGSSEMAEPVEAGPAERQEDQYNNSEDAAGGQDSMAKDATGKTAKSNWHQIRSGATPAAATDVVEAAKQALPTEEAPKAMAAAAAADGASASASDSSTIASIVDSVLADLRPKIVEEIAKKLARK